MRHERTDCRPGRADFRPARVDFSLRGQISGLRGSWGTDGRTDEQMDGRMDGRTKVLLCSMGLCPLWGRCPASSHFNLQPCKAGQRVSLTKYCPWATCSLCHSYWGEEMLSLGP